MNVRFKRENEMEKNEMKVISERIKEENEIPDSENW